MDFKTHTITRNTDIDSDVSKRNNNDNVRFKRNEKDEIADKLVERLNNPDSRLFYCKVAHNLSEAQIWNNLEVALRGRNPQKYFSWLCKQMLQ